MFKKLALFLQGPTYFGLVDDQQENQLFSCEKWKHVESFYCFKSVIMLVMHLMNGIKYSKPSYYAINSFREIIA